MLKAFSNCYKELEALKKFHISVDYAFNKTENLEDIEDHSTVSLIIQNSQSIVERPITFGLKGKHAFTRRRALNEVVYVRVISILEVYLTDSLLDIFAESKTPFKSKNEFKISQSELLSISQEDLFDRVISKECRKLSSGGFDIIVKYYKKNFHIDVSIMSPGLRKMQEYHDKRHLLVHRLGSTDEKYRRKYSTEELKIKIDNEYLDQAFSDIYSFVKEINRKILLLIKAADN
jgi:hypothetical protein